MICRHIVNNPEAIKEFDFFNDYDDTKSWLRGFRGKKEKETEELLDKEYLAWLEKRRADFLTRQKIWKSKVNKKEMNC